MGASKLAEWELFDRREGLVIECVDQRITVDRWPQFGLWLSSCVQGALEVAPLLSVVGEGAAPVGLRLVGELIGSGMLAKPRKDIRLDAARRLTALLSDIPFDVRRTVTAAGVLQWRLLRLIAAFPPFLKFLSTADGGRTWHYVLAVLSRDSGMREPAQLARLLMFEGRQSVLAGVAGVPRAKRLLSVFGKLPRLGFDTADYDWLIREGSALPNDELLSHLVPIGDPLRGLSVRLVDRDQDQALRLPPPPFTLRGLLEPLASLAALEEEGRVMANCVGSLAARVRGGGYCVFRWLGCERATVALIHRRGSWRIAEMKAYGNAAVKAEAREAVQLAVSAVGANGRRGGVSIN